MNTALTYTAMAAMLVAGSVLGVAALDYYTTPVVVTEVCMGDTCSTVSMTQGDAHEACERMAAMPMVLEMGGVKPDSPCGRVLGL